MAIEVHVLIQVVNSSEGMILFKGEKLTSVVVPEGTPLEGCYAVAKARMGSIVSETENDVMEQIGEAERSI